MRIEEIRQVEDCFDESFIKEYLLSDLVTQEFIRHLGAAGDLQYFPQFAKPFYRLRVLGCFILQGIEGTNSVRFIFERGDLKQAQDVALQLIESYGATDKSSLHAHRET